MGNVNIKGYTAVTSERFGIIANQCCFETGRFIYNLNVLRQNLSNSEHCCELNKVTKIKVAGSKPSKCKS